MSRGSQTHAPQIRTLRKMSLALMQVCGIGEETRSRHSERFGELHQQQDDTYE